MSTPLVYAVQQVVVALAKDGESLAAFCGRCEWSTRQQRPDDMAREIADHMRVCPGGQS